MDSETATEIVTVRDAFYGFLRSAGVTTLFGNPGSTELPMLRDFPADFRYVLALQESVAAGMADGYAQATRNAAVVSLHSAAGVGHALGNIFTAWKNKSPLLIIAGQQARSILPFDPFLAAKEATEFPRPYVKWSCEPARAQDVPRAVARAYYTAMQAPRGPVFISVPVDDWDQPAEVVAFRDTGSRAQGDPEKLKRIADALVDARQPVFVVGAEVALDEAWEEVIILAERHNASVWVSPMSARNSFPEGHPLFAGFLPARREGIVESLSGHDLILVLGAPVFTYHVEGFGPHIPADSQLFQITSDPEAAARAAAGDSVVADLKPGLAELLDGPRPPSRPAPAPRSCPAPVDSSRLTQEYVLQELARVRPAGSVIVEEAPSAREAMHDLLPITEADGFYTCASGGLGHGMPAAVGVALGRPGVRVIGLLGDGSSMYSIQALWSAAQLNLPVTFVILNNSSYDALVDFGRHFGLDDIIGTQLPGIDFCGLARAQGCRAHRVEEAAALAGTLEQALQSDRPTLVEVIIVGDSTIDPD
ncbi:MAG: benzoylformate decarboxylase [Gammaproteobacteria bacterium]